MRVTHVIGQLVPGGSEKMTLQVAGAFVARGEQHSVVALGEVDHEWVTAIAADVPVTSLGIADRGAGGSARGLARLAALLRRRKPDVIHGHAWRSSVAAGIIGSGLGRPAVATLHRVYYPRVERRLDRFLQRAWDVVLVDSEAVRRRLATEVALQADRIAVIPNFVAAEYFAITPPPQRGEGPLRLLMAAAFTPFKGHDTLLRALRVLRDACPGTRPSVHVDLVGDGPTLEEMRALAERFELGRWVSFHGRRRDLGRWIAASDAIVLPSSWEGFGMILAEGSAASRPVVACDVGGAAEVVVNGETGLLTPAGDAAALAAALRLLADDEALRRRLGAAGRERAARLYASTPVMDAYVDLYGRLTSGHRRARPLG